MAAPNLALRCVCFVNKVGTDDAGYNAVGRPESRLTIAAALADLLANYGAATALAPHYVSMGPGTYTTPAFALPPFTYIVGSADAADGGETIILLTGNVTLSAGWSVNQTAFGGFEAVIMRQEAAQNIDLTVPTPAAGNPSRTITLRNVSTNVDNLLYEATGTGDAIEIFDCVHNGNNGDLVRLEGGTITINGLLTAAPVVINATAIATAGQAYGIFYTSVAGLGLTCSTDGAAACTVRLGACDLRALRLSETGAGAIAVSADAISIPLNASLTFAGTAVNADLTRTTDGSAIATIGTFTGLNGQTIVGDILGSWAVNANGTAQNVTLSPSSVGTNAGGRLILVGGAVTAPSGGILPGQAFAITSTSTAFLNGSFLSGAPFAFCLDTNNSYPIALQAASVTAPVLIGTIVDSANGRLQLASHTTIAGGIGIGTDIAVYRLGTTRIGFDAIAGINPIFDFLETGVARGRIQTASGVMTISSLSSASLVLQSNAITALTIDASQNSTFVGAIFESTDTLSGAGAVSVTKTTTRFTSTGGAEALTLADGTNGQIKRVVHVVDGGSGVLTPATKTGYTTITFTNAGDAVTLQFVTTQGWCIVGIFGAVAA